jgi:hypothetical protein
VSAAFAAPQADTDGDGISFEVRRGEGFGILGPNGHSARRQRRHRGAGVALLPLGVTKGRL